MTEGQPIPIEGLLGRRDRLQYLIGVMQKTADRVGQGLEGVETPRLDQAYQLVVRNRVVESIDNFRNRLAQVQQQLEERLPEVGQYYSKQIQRKEREFKRVSQAVESGRINLPAESLASYQIEIQQLKTALGLQPEEPRAPRPPHSEKEAIEPARVVLIDKDRKEIEINGKRKKFKASTGPAWQFINFLAWMNNPQRIYSASKLNELARFWGSTAKENPGNVLFRNTATSMEDTNSEIFISEGTNRNTIRRVNATFAGFVPAENPEFSPLKQLDLTPAQMRVLEPLLKATKENPLEPYIWGEYVYDDEASIETKIGRITTAIRQRISDKLESAGFRLVNLSPHGRPARYYLEKIVTAGPTQPTEGTGVSLPPNPAAVESARLLALRDRFILDPLYPPAKDYSSILSSPQVTEFLARNDTATQRLAEAFLAGRGASRILNAIVRFSGTETLGSERFTQYLAGAMFEEIAYLHTTTLDRGERPTVLSPEETIILFRNIHRDKELVAEDYGLNFMIEGVNIPDGLVISETEDALNIVLILEAKNIGQEPDLTTQMQIAAQRQAYYPETLEASLRLKNHQPLDPQEIGRLISAIKPSLSAKPVRVSPELQPLYLIPRRSNLSLEGVLVEAVPITSSAIHALGESLKRVKLLSGLTG